MKLFETLEQSLNRHLTIFGNQLSHIKKCQILITERILGTS